jgi:hypothetical protein
VRRRAAALTAAALFAAALFPHAASAHGLVGRQDLPIPQWLFAWAASIVLIASFVGLATLWGSPRLQQLEERRVAGLPRALARAARMRECHRPGSVRNAQRAARGFDTTSPVRWEYRIRQSVSTAYVR